MQRVADAAGSKAARIGYAKGEVGRKLDIALGSGGQPLTGYATLHHDQALHLCLVAPLTEAPKSRRAQAAR